MDRRTFLARGLTLAAATGPAAALLASCSSSSPGGTAAPAPPGSAPGSAPASTPGATPGTTFPPVPYDPATPYWLQGGFAPVATETATTSLEVTGALPPELTGLYVRNGSNPATGTSPHWFLGDGMVHGVHLDRGKAVSYRCRYLDTPQHREHGDYRAGPPGGASNQSNVSVFHHAGKLLSSGEVGWPYEVSTSDLSSEPYDYDGRLKTAMTAHPKIDPATGKLHFFGYGFVPPYLTYHVVSADGVLESSEEVAIPGPAMIHDFAITERDVVFWDLPVLFDTQKVIESSKPGAAGSFPYSWKPEYGARVGVMPLGGPASAIRWVDVDPCYVFHGVNAHRDGDEIQLEVCVVPSMFEGGRDLDQVVNQVHRWTIDTSGPALTWTGEQVSDIQMDLPSIDRRHTGREVGHAWYVMVDKTGPAPLDFGGLCHRRADGSTDVWSPGPRYRPNEGFFVPAADTSAEGEGWLLSYVWDRARDATDLCVFASLDLAKGPVASVHLPTRVPYGFHGDWLPGATP